MIYPANFESKVGFDRIRTCLEEYCLSEMGRAGISSIHFSEHYDEILEKLESTSEFREILLSTRSFPGQDYFDLREELHRLTIQGTYIDPEKLGELRCSLRTIADIILYFKRSEAHHYPRLKKIVEPVYFDESIIGAADRILDDKGHIRDNASSELKKIRGEQADKKILIERRIRQIYLSLKKEGITAEDAEITIRNGRSVIPLPATNKRRIKGFIHDESSTGQTIFIEPEEVFELNNDLRELESAEKREVIRILTRFTDELRPQIEPLLTSYNVLASLDLIRAKASFALHIKAVLPKTSPLPRIDLRKAINPILLLTSMSTGKEVVPLDIRLNEDDRILIISGPNAGGKSVCLKTTGLLQYMLQCGMLIPVKEESETGIFRNIFIEIGDEQSIENDLSTYSSHLRHIKHLTETGESHTLFLIDEFGSGTEPQSGGAIAEATLEKLSNTGAMGVVTTHYLNLKLMAGRIPGIVNGAMMFDTKKMIPLYQLVIGKPGSSFAFEIAGNIGFPKDILENAGQKTGSTALDFEQQLQMLETERRELEQQKAEFSIGDELLTSLVERYKSMNEKLESSRKQILDQARNDAGALLAKTNQMIEKTIRTIKESNADKQKTMQARREIADYSERIKEPEPEKETSDLKKPGLKKTTNQKPSPKMKETPKDLPLVKGGFARIKGQPTIVEIEDIKGKYAMVVSNNLKMKIPTEQLEATEDKIDNKAAKKTAKLNYSNIAQTLNDKLAAFNPNIDVRGARAEEIMPVIQKFIDEAVLLNVPEVLILHGKGNGVLRHIIREYLRTVDEVRSISDAALERGGDGNTIVRFR